MLCEEYKDIFSLFQDFIGHKKITIYIDTGDQHPIAKELYTLPLKHTQWVHA